MYAMKGVSKLMCDPRYGAETLTLRRYNNSFTGGISIVDGRRQRAEQPFFEVQILCAVQPCAGDDLLQVPEGDRFNEQLFIWVWHTSEKPQANDYVLREGQQYIVQAATDWNSYCQARIQRLDVGPDRARDV